MPIKRLILTILLTSSTFSLFAQDEEESKKISITFSGFVRNDIFYDSRQTTASREGYFNFFPKPVEYDVAGKDMNDQSRLTMLAISTRLSGNITGPKVFSAKSSALFEADFFGHSETDINGFRLRHAITKLNWEKAELMIGQYWNPMFLTECLPGTVSFNSGAPFHPFARNPQVRFTYKHGSFGFMLAALSQRDYASNGPKGPSAEYLRNSGIPELQLKLYYQKINPENKTEFLVGAGAGYKVIQPFLFQEFTQPLIPFTYRVRTDEKISGKSFHFFLKTSGHKHLLKTQFVYGENLHDLLMLGGYAVKNWSSPLFTDVLWKYTPTRTLSAWLSYNTIINSFEPGIFAGFTKNLGSTDRIESLLPEIHYFGRGFSIDYVYRIAPRLFYNAGAVKFGAELEHTAAAYGNSWDSNLKVLNSEEVSNTRVLFTITYSF